MSDSALFWILAGIAGIALADTLTKEKKRAVEAIDSAAGDTSNVKPKYEKEFNDVNKLFENELYSQAVLDACKILCQAIRDRSKITELDGVKLVSRAFGEKGSLCFDIFPDQACLDLHQGYTDLCRGVIGGFRNGHAHAILSITKEDAAWQVELIVHLVDAVMNKTVPNKKTGK